MNHTHFIDENIYPSIDLWNFLFLFDFLQSRERDQHISSWRKYKFQISIAFLFQFQNSKPCPVSFSSFEWVLEYRLFSALTIWSYYVEEQSIFKYRLFIQANVLKKKFHQFFLITYFEHVVNYWFSYLQIRIFTKVQQYERERTFTYRME